MGVCCNANSQEEIKTTFNLEPAKKSDFLELEYLKMIKTIEIDNPELSVSQLNSQAKYQELEPLKYEAINPDFDPLILKEKYCSDSNITYYGFWYLKYIIRNNKKSQKVI